MVGSSFEFSSPIIDIVLRQLSCPKTQGQNCLAARFTRLPQSNCPRIFCHMLRPVILIIIEKRVCITRYSYIINDCNHKYANLLHDHIE